MRTSGVVRVPTMKASCFSLWYPFLNLNDDNDGKSHMLVDHERGYIDTSYATSLSGRSGDIVWGKFEGITNKKYDADFWSRDTRK